jgi:hypothetical protein
MTTLSDKFNNEALRNIHEQLSEIQLIATSTNSTDWELASTLDDMTRIAGMFCNVIEQQLNGIIVTSNPLEYIEGKLTTAYALAKQIEKRNTD